MKFSKILLVCLLFYLRLPAQNNMKTENLLDKDLSNWYKWLGVPHTSVSGLPAGTPTGDGMNGIPLGLKDPKNVFSVVTLGGEKVLRVTGEIYGGLTTKKEYENYHFQLKYKWGKKKWVPRSTLPRDMGIMFNLTGTNEDAFWSVFMMGLECQISEGTSGDLFLVPNKTFTVFPFAEARVNDTGNWDPSSPWRDVGAKTKFRMLRRSKNFESDSTEWTTMDVYTHGSSAVYLVNGHVVMAFRNAGLLHGDKTVSPLTKGKIQLQSEGAEGYYKDITIQSISDIPDDLKIAAGLDFPHVWKLGVALYTFHVFSFPEELAKADSAGVNYVEGFTFGRAGALLKDSIIMRLSPQGIGKLKDLIDKSGLKMESIYVVGGTTIDAWRKEFDIAKQLNVKYVTAEPPKNMWDAVDSLAGVYGIKLAIHNHWKGMSAYWSPDSVLAAFKGHPNFWACADVGHWPKSGINPLDGLKKLEGHLLALHFKDIAAYNNPKLLDVPVGTGVIDFPAVFKELKRQKFEGYIIIERDGEDKPSNLASVIETVKYYNKQLGLPETTHKPLGALH
jgi:L-ribulose-5-phosphate 3-epimerase